MARDGSEERERYWQRAIREHRESGLSIRSFCETKGLSEPSFYYWQRRLRATMVGSTKGNNKLRRGTPLAPFVPVKIQPMVMASDVIEVVHRSGHVLRVPAAFDVESLVGILAALDREGA